MKPRSRIDSSNLAYSFGSIILVGAVTSGLLTKDTRWMNWHFSRLGEGGTFSSMIFNLALIISAAFMFELGVVLSDDISRLSKGTNTELNRAKTLISRSFSAVATCLIVVALFPFDKFPVIHNIFGYSMLFIFMYLCAVMPKILPIFSQKFQKYSQLIILSAIICYVLFIGARAITLLTVEFVIVTMLYIWLLMLIDNIRKTDT
jgi:hypothetical protein